MMKKILLLILIPFLLSAQNVWYVNRDAPGPVYDGTSRATAWNGFDSDGYDNMPNAINWSLISAGDTIYISGGTDSTVYRPWNGEGYMIQDEVITGGQVILTPDWYPNHNGDVYFMNSHLTVQYGPYAGQPVQSNVQIVGSTGMKFVDLKFIVNQPQGTTITTPQSVALVLERDSLITFENCHIKTNGVAGAIGMDTPANIKIINCRIESDYNIYTNDNDIFTWSQAGYGELLIDNNVIINRDAYEGFSHSATGITVDSVDATTFTLTISGASMATNYHRWAAIIMDTIMMVIHSNDGDTFTGEGWVLTSDGVTPVPMPTDIRSIIVACLAHRDVMQMGYGNNPNRPTTKFTNNHIWVLYSQDVNSWNQMHYLGTNYEDISRQNFVYINNLFITPVDTNGNGIAVISQNWANPLSMSKWEFYNNTLITSGGWIGTMTADSIISYNNVMVTLNPEGVIRIARNDSVSVDSIDYNYYSIPNWDSRTWLDNYQFLWDNYQYYNWDTWKSVAGNDIHSRRDSLGEFEFHDIQDSTINAYIPPVILRDQGRDLSYLATKYPEIMFDINGDERGYGSGWDIGALEYTGGAAPVDSTPSNVVFNTDVTNAELNTQYTGAIYELADFDSGYVHISRGWYNIDGGAWKDSNQWAMVFPTNDIAVRDTSSTEYSTSKSIVLTIGNASDTWTVTTKDQPTSGGKSLRSSNGKLIFASDGKRIITSGTSYTPPPGEPDITAPNPPTSFVAIGGSSQTQFQTNWTNPSASDLDSIRYYEGSSNDTTTMNWIVSLPASTGYLRTGRTSNTTYWCAVKAVDDSGNVSYFSNTDSATTLSTPEGGTPLQNLKLAYLTQSFGSHLYDHSFHGDAGTTTMQSEITAYNTLYGLAGANACSIVRVTPDYPSSGDMIWDWNEVFEDGSDYGNTQYIVDDYLTDTTYSIVQVVTGFNSGAIWFAPWYIDAATDTVTYQMSHIAGVYKWWSRKMLAVMEQYPYKYFIWWTIPPINVPDGGSQADADRQADFNLWMTDTLQAGLDSYGAFPSNVYIFDVFDLLQSGNSLRSDYADSPTDAHPNENAASDVAPIYIQRVFDNARAYRRPE